MNSLTALQTQIKELNRQHQYKKVTDALSDSILTQYNDAVLYYESGIAREEIGEYDRAIRDFTRAITLSPDQADYYCERALAWSHLGDYNKAVKDYTKGLALAPDDVINYFNRAEAWKVLGEWDKAFADYERAIQLKPDFGMGYTGRGFIWLLKEELDKVIADFSKAIRLKPDNAFAMQYRGMAWIEKEDYIKAIEDLNKAIALAPDSADIYIGRGDALFEKGKYDKALQDYQKAIALQPDYPEAHYGMGEVWYARKEYAKAVDEYTRVIELKPYDMLAYNNRAYAWRALGEYDKAIEDLDVSIGLDPTSPDEWFSRGDVKANKLEKYAGPKSDYEDAIRDFDEAIRLDPDYASAYHRRGVLWNVILEHNKAIKDFEKALQLDPADTLSKNWLANGRNKLAKMLGPKTDEERQAIREQAATFVEQLKKDCSARFKNTKDGFIQGWHIEEWDAENSRPLLAGILGWLPELRPDIAQWMEVPAEGGGTAIAVCTPEGEEFWPSLVGIPIKKYLWQAIVCEGLQYRIGEKPIRGVKRFFLVAQLLEKIIERIRTGDLDHEIVFGEYKLPTQMEEFEAMLRNIANTPYQPKKKK